MTQLFFFLVADEQALLKQRNPLIIEPSLDKTLILYHAKKKKT